MSLITTTNLGKSFGPVDIFSGISLAVPPRGRIALVGPNGVGKTTLLRILIGDEEPSEGDVQRARGLRVGYLPQEASVAMEGTLWDVARQAFARLAEMEDELARLEAQMADPALAEEALEAYARLQPVFEHQGGYTYDQRIRQTLTGLGFAVEDYHRPVTQLSGGQRTRALLAQLLMAEPDLLLLDEPTNHLDISAVEWLEDYLKDYPGTVLVVSHDRYFMDQVAQTIWEMTPAFESYPGNYSAYLNQRQARYERQIEEYQAQQAFIEKEEEYIRRNIAGQNTRQAQGRRKRLERLLEEARLAPPPGEARKMKLRLQASQRSGDLVIRTRDLAVGYEDEGRPLFHAPDLLLRRGECVALIGPNGAGKTTFLKTLLGQIPPFGGEVILGASLQIGYFAQAHEGLHGDLDLVQEINTVAPELRPGEVRDYLARFLFTREDVFKPVGLLSGGERGRLALAKLALSGANLLLLDEPTNHLDLPAQEVLQGILAGYDGTILLVSHDRYLIDALATQIWEVEPQRLHLRVFTGSYSEYRALRQAEAAARAAAEAAARAAERPAPTAAARAASNAQSTAERKRRQRLQALEGEISQLEETLAELGRRLERPPEDPAVVHRLGQEYVSTQHALEQLLEEWGALSQAEHQA